MDIAFYIFGLIFLSVSWIILLGGPKNFKAPSRLSIPEFEQNKSLVIAIFCPVIGLIIIGKNVYDWRVSGVASQMIYHSIIMGSGAVLYGLYRGWRWSKEKQLPLIKLEKYSDAGEK